MSIIHAHVYELAKKIKLARFKINKMDALENYEECLILVLVTSCDM